MHIFEIHDNGSRPFSVEISNKNVKIYKNKNNLIAEYEVEEVLIGKSLENEITKFSAGFGNKFDGNSILLHLGGLQYVFIGWDIYEFTTASKIAYYESPVGNNNAPYPWACDDLGYYYMLIEKRYFQKKSNTTKFIYNYYWEDILPENCLKIANIKIIHERIW